MLDTHFYCRRLRLKHLFDGSTPPPSDIPSKLYVPSNFNPPQGKNASLDLYCTNITHDAAHYKPPKNIHHNITTNQRQQLKTLRQDTTLTIREADKGGKLVVMDTSDYNASIQAMLDNQATYAPLLADPTPEIKNLINQHILFLKEKNIVPA